MACKGTNEERKKAIDCSEGARLDNRDSINHRRHTTVIKKSVYQLAACYFPRGIRACQVLLVEQFRSCNAPQLRSVNRCRHKCPPAASHRSTRPEHLHICQTHLAICIVSLSHHVLPLTRKRMEQAQKHKPTQILHGFAEIVDDQPLHGADGIFCEGNDIFEGSLAKCLAFAPVLCHPLYHCHPLLQLPPWIDTA